MPGSPTSLRPVRAHWLRLPGNECSSDSLARAAPEELWVQFHEVALGWKLWRKPHLHLVHAVELWMADALARRADRIFVSIEAWKRRLGAHADRAVWLPIPSNIPVSVEPAE